MFVFLFAALLAQAHPLTLDEAVKLSLERNPDLRRQTLLMLSAEQDKVLARANLLPRVDFNASYQDTRQGAGTVVYGPVVQQVDAEEEERKSDVPDQRDRRCARMTPHVGDCRLGPCSRRGLPGGFEASCSRRRRLLCSPLCPQLRRTAACMPRPSSTG